MNIRPIYKPGEFAKLLNVSVKTLQRWDNDGTLKAKRTETNRRYYTYEQYLTHMKSKQDKDGTASTWAVYVGTAPGESWQSTFQKTQKVLMFCKEHDISTSSVYAEANQTEAAEFTHDALLELTMAIMRNEINGIIAVGLKDIDLEFQTLFRYIMEAKHVTIKDLDIAENTESENSTDV